jgi:CHAT domain-containing protein/tetratricopeptide (TPR) repeat protein
MSYVIQILQTLGILSLLGGADAPVFGGASPSNLHHPQKRGGDLKVGVSSVALARAHLKAGDPKAALAECDRASLIINATKSERWKAELAILRSEVLRQMKSYDLAIESALLAVEHLKNSPSRRALKDAYLTLVVLYDAKGDKGKVSFYMSLYVDADLGDCGYAIMRLDGGLISDDQAKKLLDKGTAIASNPGDLLFCLVQRAAWHRHFGRHDPAVAALMEALRISEKTHSPVHPRYVLLQQISELKMLQGDERRGAQYMRQARHEAERAGDYEDVADIDTHGCAAMTKLGQKNHAFRCFDKLLKWCIAKGLVECQGKTGLALGDHVLRRDYVGALAYYFDAHTAFDKLKSTHNRGVAAARIGNVWNLQGRPRRAIVAYSEAMRDLKKGGRDYGYTAISMAVSFLAVNNLDMAISSYFVGLDAIEDASVSNWQLKARQAPLSSSYSLSGLYDNLIDLYVKRAASGTSADADRDKNMAFGLSEISRASLLMYRMIDRGIELSDGLSREFADEEAEIKEGLHAASKIAAGIDDAMRQKLKVYWLQKQEAYVARLRESEEFASYAELRFRRMVNISDVSTAKGETVIKFHVTGEHVIRWIIKAGRLVDFRLIPFPVDEIRGEVALLINAIKRKEAAVGSAILLYRYLLDGVGEDVDRVVIIPDGFLHDLPFETLRVDAGTSPFGLRVAISYAPSVRTLLALSRWGGGAQPKRPLLIIGDPVFNVYSDDRCRFSSNSEIRMQCRGRLKSKKYSLSRDRGAVGAARLPGTREEVRRIVDVVGKSSSDILLDFDANKRKVLELVRSYRYSVVHFATHGVVPGAIPFCILGDCVAQPALLLAHGSSDKPNDSFLTMSDVYGTRINADLVIVSACKSGVGELHESEGVLGVGQAFLYAGARGVITGRWTVEDEPTILWMTTFYSERANGKDSAEAALRARQVVSSIVGGKNDWSVPYFWAPTFLMGG